jgi:phage terminase large subunit-like protein
MTQNAVGTAAASNRAELLALLEERERRNKRRQFYRLFPDHDILDADGNVLVHARHKYPKHLEFFAAGVKYRERASIAANRCGKALRNGTQVATPSGWRPIEGLSVGDDVIAGDGSITTVTGVYPQGRKPLYRMTFDQGETIDCCAEHLWLYQPARSRYPYRYSHHGKENNPRYGEWHVADTQTILAEASPVPGPRSRVVMPTSQPWRMPTREVPFDPYLLGLLLGDGTLHSTVVAFSTVDAELLEAFNAALPGGCYTRHLGRCTYKVMSGAPRRYAKSGGSIASHPLIIALAALGAYGKRSHEKFVPREYLLNDPDTRLAVLQGLMDTDGSISTGGAMEFSTVSQQLAEDVQFLVHSLGGKATIKDRQTCYTHKGERRIGRLSYRVRIRINICPFRLERKAERWAPRHNTPNRVLHRIDPVDTDEATCISVAHPERTYVTAHGIVTHNTYGLGGYETVCHLTGLYPDWWPGRRFNRPIHAWAAGDWNETTRDIIQATLCGKVAYQGTRRTVDGTGLIPGDLIGDAVWKQGVPNLLDTLAVKHVSGDWSWLGFKSYQQGRASFQGTARDLIWLDEEPPLDVYTECLTRTATTGGMMILTFTPLRGYSDVVRSFRPEDQIA